MTTPATVVPNNATTQRVSVGGGKITFSVNQFLPQMTEIQLGQSVTFFTHNGSIEPHNVIFDLTNGTTISDLWLPFTLPPDALGGEVPTDVAEELFLAPQYNLGEPRIQNITMDDGGERAITGLNKIAWQLAVLDQNDNVIYLQEQELSQQMHKVEEAFQGGPQPAPLSTSYTTMDGTERIVSSGIILDVNGFAALEELFPEERQGSNQEIVTNSTTTTPPPLSPDEEAMTQHEQPMEEFPPSPFPLLGSFTVTFDEPGTYDYFCAFHPGMFGQVVVGGG